MVPVSEELPVCTVVCDIDLKPDGSKGSKLKNVRARLEWSTGTSASPLRAVLSCTSQFRSQAARKLSVDLAMLHCESLCVASCAFLSVMF